MADFGGKPGGNDGIARALGQQAGEFEENLSDFISFKYYFKEEKSFYSAVCNSFKPQRVSFKRFKV